MNQDRIDEKIKSFERRQIVVILIALLAACGISIIFNNLHMTSIAEENTRFLTRFVSTGEGREVGIILNQAQATNFNVIRYISREPDRNFILPTALEYEKSSLDFMHSLIYDRAETVIKAPISTSNGDEIIYEFNRFRLVPYAFFAWMFFVLALIPQALLSRRRLIEQLNTELQVEKKLAKAEMARVVRHNFRTPLAALLRVPSRLPEMAAKEREIINITLNQMQGLLGKLDDEMPADSVKTTDFKIYDTLIAARQEINLSIPSRINFNFEIEDIICSDLVYHIPFELRSILSNMVQNSIESIHDQGSITVRAFETVTHVVIKVSDTGCGIPQDILSKIFDQNFTYNKKSGSGIGLYHAKSFITQWSGLLEVDSIKDVGSVFTVKLPIKDKESWYLPEVKLSRSSQIYILDDQESALALWKQKFSETFYESQISIFNNVADFVKTSSRWNENSVFLIDYDLGKNSPNGIEVMQSIQTYSVRCLVTGHFDDLDIRNKCSELGINLVPKSHIENLLFTI